VAWQELFGTTIGLIEFVYDCVYRGHAIFLARYFSRKMDEDARNARKN
jgi:hypothetical protein